MGNFVPAVEINKLVKERMVKYGVQKIKMQETVTEDMFCTVSSAVTESLGVVLGGTYRIKGRNTGGKNGKKEHRE